MCWVCWWKCGDCLSFWGASWHMCKGGYECWVLGMGLLALYWCQVVCQLVPCFVNSLGPIFVEWHGYPVSYSLCMRDVNLMIWRWHCVAGQVVPCFSGCAVFVWLLDPEDAEANTFFYTGTQALVPWRYKCWNINCDYAAVGVYCLLHMCHVYKYSEWNCLHQNKC
jgi:hypothetical protein